MKSNTRVKTHRDQTLLRDLGFLMLLVGVLLIKGFDQTLPDALLYAPLIVAGAFGALLGGAYVLLGVLRIAEATAQRLGLQRGPRY